MPATAWKWLLQVLDDALLVNIAKALQIRVPGFRGDNWDRSIKLLRPRIVQSMLKTKQLTSLRHAADEEVQQDKDLLALRDRNEQQLLEQVPNQLAPARVLLALLSSSDADVAAKGESLYRQWHDLGVLIEEPESARGAEASDSDAPQLDKCEQRIVELEAKLKRREKKAQKLAVELAKQKANFARAKRRWQQERKQLVKQLAERATVLKQYEQQLAELLEQQQGESVSTVDAEGSHATMVEGPTSERQTMPSIAVVGNLQQMNSPAEHNADYKLIHITPNELQSEQVATSLQKVDQVWLLTYATPLPLQRRLRQMVPPEILSCFATYQDYMHNLGQGV